VGRDLGTLLARDPIGVVVSSDFGPSTPAADVAVLMTASRMLDVVDVAAALMERGVRVLTSAEELAYPWHEFPEQSEYLDDLAGRTNTALLGTGANPGFLMDLLPSVLTLATQEVTALHIRRTMDLRPHRAGRLTRFAIGKTEQQFLELPSAEVHGHIGFRQSIDALADALQLDIDRVVEEPLRPSVIAECERRGDFVAIAPKTIAVLTQGAVGYRNTEAVITLQENFGFVDDGDPVLKGDECVVEGADQSFTVNITPGVLSFVTTPAVLVNMISPLATCPPGFKSMFDFPVGDIASKGSGKRAAGGLLRRRGDWGSTPLERARLALNDFRIEGTPTVLNARTDDA
jgi:hypothetical protein